MEVSLLFGVVLPAIVMAAALGIALGRYVWPSVPRSIADALARSQVEVAGLGQECSSLRNRADQRDTEHKAAAAEAQKVREEAVRLTERVAGFEREAAEQTVQTNALKAKLGQAESEAKSAGEKVAQLEEREKALAQAIEAQRIQLAGQQKQLTAEFENIANRILKANATELSETSQKAVAAMLDPLRERIQDFQKKVETTYEAESRDVLSLKDEIKRIVETSHSIGTQADGLAKVLRGDSQLRGRWGELALERILESAGLTEGREYVSQGQGLGLKNGNGGIQKPDIVIKLPEERTMIVDSKVSLLSYERLVAAEVADRGKLADEFVDAVKTHIKDLEAKCYQDNEKLQAHECALMFVPIEGALAAALTRTPELFVYAWDRRVVLVGPSTLLMTLRTVASIWRGQRQGENAQEIAVLAGDLCDKVSASLADFNRVTGKITDALSAHNESVRRLSSGKGNALWIGERMQALGVKPKKPMPSMPADGVLATSGAEDSSYSS